MYEDFSLRTSQGNILRVSLFGKENYNSAPCLIYVHGFKGFKDWGFVPYLAEYFANKGFFVLTFNFSHNGVGPSLVEFDELDKFAKNTMSLEIEEFGEIIAAYQNEFFGSNPYGVVGTIGHSRGGAVNLLTSGKYDIVKSVCTWASICNFDRYTERQETEWRTNGFLELVNSRTKQVMRLNIEFLNDLNSNRDGTLNIQNAVKNLNKDLLLIHGEEDLTVPIKEAFELYDWSDKTRTDLVKIPACGHTFNVEHPFSGSNDKFNSVLEHTLKFFKTTLS